MTYTPTRHYQLIKDSFFEIIQNATLDGDDMLAEQAYNMACDSRQLFREGHAGDLDGFLMAHSGMLNPERYFEICKMDEAMEE